MLRKATVSIILLSMTVHCASRVGLLSYLYEHRHDISYQIGLIAEIPIAICSSDYDFNKGLKIQELDGHESSLPSQLVQAKEIMLFFQYTSLLVKNPSIELMKDHFTSIPQKRYTRPAISIFHPPS